jgi:hypothetical protein
MSKAALITGLFVAILFLYLFVMLRQTMHSVSKIEAFSTSSESTSSEASEAGSSTSTASTASTSTASTSSESTSSTSSTSSEASEAASTSVVGGSRKMDKEDVPPSRKEKEETTETFDDAPLPGTNTRKLKSLLEDDDGQRAIAREVERDEDAIIPRHTLGITAPEGIPFPAKNDVIGNDDQRIYWIANVLYELNPDNGMAQFIDEVRGLARIHRDHTFAEIISKLKEYTRDKARENSKSNTINELVHITKELSHKVQSLPNSLITPLHRSLRVPAPLEPATDGIEMFVADPSSYTRAYSAFTPSEQSP